jgi:hypothetical protein
VLRFGVDEPLAQAFYTAADAVLANSVSELLIARVEDQARRQGLVSAGRTTC